MKKTILPAVILLLIIAIPIGSTVSSAKKQTSVKLATASTISYQLRELADALNLFIADSNGERCPYDAALEKTHASLGMISGALKSVYPLTDNTGRPLETHPMPDGIEGLNFIAGCLSATYKSNWNNDRIEGILVDGVIDENEREYINRLRDELLELRKLFLREDGLNFNSELDFDEVLESVDALISRFYYDPYSADPAWRLLKR